MGGREGHSNARTAGSKGPRIAKTILKKKMLEDSHNPISRLTIELQ